MKEEKYFLSRGIRNGVRLIEHIFLYPLLKKLRYIFDVEV
jgi:hypothetical protein